jgi:hypothetical protein
MAEEALRDEVVFEDATQQHYQTRILSRNQIYLQVYLL